MAGSPHASGTPAKRPIVLGVTGPIASGKSTVAGMLADLGAEHIDADRVYHSLMASGSPLWKSVVERFGDGIVGPAGELDRRKLGSIVFNDPSALADLERITHPAVVREIRAMVNRSRAPAVVIEAIKLVQAGLLSDLDQLWLVNADPSARIERLMARNGLDRDTATYRITSASDPLPASVHPNVIIDNSGSSEDTRHRVGEAWDRLVTDATDTESRKHQHMKEDQ